jgi:hypothetical protein
VSAKYIEVAQTKSCGYTFVDILIQIKPDKQESVVTHRCSQERGARPVGLSAHSVR